MGNIKIKRVYDLHEQTDGLRILVDRIWPRGIKKKEAKLNDWLKEIAPSSELRKWFNHEPEKFQDFTKKYIEELQKDEEKKEAFSKLINKTKQHDISLLYAAKDEKHNQAVVLKKELQKRIKEASH